MIGTIRRMVSSIRPPDPVSIRGAPPLSPGPFAATLSSGRTPVEAIEGLLPGLPADGSILIVPSIASRPGRGAHPHLVARLIMDLGSRATLATPAASPAPIRGRWERLARDRGAATIRLGDAGWTRVTLPDNGYLLDEALLPAELDQFDHCIVIPAFGDESLALGFLQTLTHPHTGLRASRHILHDLLGVEIATTAALLYLLDASRLPGVIATNLAVLADTPLSAELVAIAIERFIDAERGAESIGSWERARVQAASELGFGPSSGSELTLYATDSSPLTTFIAGDLGCEVRR